MHSQALKCIGSSREPLGQAVLWMSDQRFLSRFWHEFLISWAVIPAVSYKSPGQVYSVTLRKLIYKIFCFLVTQLYCNNNLSSSRSSRWVGGPGPILHSNCGLICITQRPFLKGSFCYCSLSIPRGNSQYYYCQLQARRPSELLSARVSPGLCADSTHYALSVQCVRSESEDVREKRSPIQPQWPLWYLWQLRVSPNVNMYNCKINFLLPVVCLNYKISQHNKVSKSWIHLTVLRIYNHHMFRDAML